MGHLSEREFACPALLQMVGTDLDAPFKAQKVDTTVTAVVKIRFTRMGRNKSPFYRIVAIDSRKRRDGRPLQNLGWYNPLKKETQLDAPAIKDWLEKGAQPSQTVENLLKKALIITP
eukprot:gene14092-16665_t